ncbi:MAG: type II secretion system F family protein [Oligoflexia bacterium]|nr:type II secretion system F family protein [Oligoflexia bacterium]
MAFLGKIFLFIGQKGVVLLIGIMFFVFAYKNSVNFFQWVEDQTYGTRDYVMKKLEFLHISNIRDVHVTYALLGLSFGFPLIVFGIISLFGKFLLAAIVALVFCLIGWKLPRPLMNHLAEKRILMYQSQMVDALNLLSNGIRAGLSLPQGIGMVVAEMPAPISQEFNMILQQNKIGSSLDECFEELVKRIPTEDNEMFVTSIIILRETGGNLAETFDTIIFVIRERIRLKQKIETYVAQGMMQGGVIFCMPTAMGLMYTISDPKSMEPLFTTALGIIALLFAIALNLIGGFVILKIVKIKV